MQTFKTSTILTASAFATVPTISSPVSADTLMNETFEDGNVAVSGTGDVNGGGQITTNAIYRDGDQLITGSLAETAGRLRISSNTDNRDITGYVSDYSFDGSDLDGPLTITFDDVEFDDAPQANGEYFFGIQQGTTHFGPLPAQKPDGTTYTGNSGPVFGVFIGQNTVRTVSVNNGEEVEHSYGFLDFPVFGQYATYETDDVTMILDESGWTILVPGFTNGFTFPGGASGAWDEDFNLDDLGDDMRVTATASAYVGGSTGGGGSRMWIEGINIDGTLVPEPTSLALLAVGGMAVVIRRRV